ncbi:MAG: hypothetical protein AB7I52_12435 [Rhizobiaceae bacterium]
MISARVVLSVALLGLAAAAVGGFVYQVAGLDWPLWPGLLGGASIFVALFALAD